MDSGLVVPVFNQRDDPIACLNKAMAFLTAIASSRFPSTNNQLRTSSNSRNQATIQDDMVTMQQVQGRKGQNADEEQQAFLADLGIPYCQAAQTTIPNTISFQTEYLDAYYFDRDDVSNAKAVLMANLYNYDSDVILEVPHFEPYHTDMDNQNFGKRFVPQQELSDEQAFWLQTSHPNTDQSASSPIKIEAPKELLKIMSSDVLLFVMDSTTLNDESVNLVPLATAPRAVDINGLPSSITIDQDAPSSSTSSTNQQQQSLIISQESSLNVQSSHTLLELIGRWSKDHPLGNVIEPENYKEAMLESSWIEAIQKQIHNFERLQVWKLVSCPDKVMLIKLKWIFEVKTDEFSGGTQEQG
nr:integrase, catalytic region, zinc finger, CCHC-type, peptidase aspartic, catalytic [Tanacetum cinerariifolium]